MSHLFIPLLLPCPFSLIGYPNELKAYHADRLLTSLAGHNTSYNLFLLALRYKNPTHLVQIRLNLTHRFFAFSS